MTTPRAVSCKYLRMRPLALAGGDNRAPFSAAVCENDRAPSFGRVLLEAYDAGQWEKLDICHSCPKYYAIRR